MGDVIAQPLPYKRPVRPLPPSPQGSATLRSPGSGKLVRPSFADDTQPKSAPGSAITARSPPPIPPKNLPLNRSNSLRTTNNTKISPRGPIPQAFRDGGSPRNDPPKATTPPTSPATTHSILSSSAGAVSVKATTIPVQAVPTKQSPVIVIPGTNSRVQPYRASLSLGNPHNSGNTPSTTTSHHATPPPPKRPNLPPLRPAGPPPAKEDPPPLPSFPADFPEEDMEMPRQRKRSSAPLPNMQLLQFDDHTTRTPSSATTTASSARGDFLGNGSRVSFSDPEGNNNSARSSEKSVWLSAAKRTGVMCARSGDYSSIPAQRPCAAPDGLGIERAIDWNQLKNHMGKLACPQSDWVSPYGGYDNFLRALREDTGRSSIFLPSRGHSRNNSARRSMNVTQVLGKKGLNF